MNNIVSLNRLCEVLNYDAETGVFTWLISIKSRAVAGATAGSFDKDGYVIIRIDKIAYRAHRLAWFYCYGQWPSMAIDHVNGMPADNRLANLREATQQQNCFNSAKARKSPASSEFKGVHWSAKQKRWVASIRIARHKTYLGAYREEREAAEAYLFAALEHHGEFARAA